MKVREILERLEGFDPEAEVIMLRDPEGNGYSPMWTSWGGIFMRDTCEPLDDEEEDLLDMDEDDEDFDAEEFEYLSKRVKKHGTRAIFLVPN